MIYNCIIVYKIIPCQIIINSYVKLQNIINIIPYHYLGELKNKE